MVDERARGRSRKLRRLCIGPTHSFFLEATLVNAAHFQLPPQAAVATMPEHRAIVVTVAPPNMVDESRLRGCCCELADTRDRCGLRRQGNCAAR
jgi:hypothetical protein